MTDWRNLSEFDKARVNDEIIKKIPERQHIHSESGFTWNEPLWTLQNVQMGNYCANCWRPEHICLCYHDEDELC